MVANPQKASTGCWTLGRSELARWAVRPAASQTCAEELMVRLRADVVLGPLGLEDEIARRKLLHEQKNCLPGH